MPEPKFQPHEDLAGVKGWLLFFVVLLTLISLLMILASPAPWSPGFSLSARLLLTTLDLLGLLGLVTSVLLVRRHQWAPRWATVWLILNIAIGIGSKFFSSGSLILFAVVLGSLLSLRYFALSRRVKATYGGAPAEGDADLSFPQNAAQKDNPYAPPGSHQAE